MTLDPYWNCPSCYWTGDTAPWNSDVTFHVCPECQSRLEPNPERHRVRP